MQQLHQTNFKHFPPHTPNSHLHLHHPQGREQTKSLLLDLLTELGLTRGTNEPDMPVLKPQKRADKAREKDVAQAVEAAIHYVTDSGSETDSDDEPMPGPRATSSVPPKDYSADQAAREIVIDHV